MKKHKPTAVPIKEDKALSLEQSLKYAADLAELYESELAQSKALKIANRELQQEIIERHRLEMELIESEKKYRSLFEDSRDPIVMTNRAGRIVHANAAFMELLGYADEEIIGESIFKVYADPASRGALRQAVEAEGSVKDFEIPLVTKDGSVLDCLFTASLRFSEGGRILGYQGIIRNITEQKRNEQVRQQAKRMEALSRLAGNIAHQIRDPLSISSSAAQLLMAHDVDPVFRAECAGKIVSGIRRATLIIENLLAYVRPFQADEMVAVEIASLVREALGTVAHEAAAQNVETIFPSSNKSLYVKGDSGLLAQAMVNLLTIFLSAPQEGGKLKIVVAPSGPDALVTFSSNGQNLKGVPIDEIFDPFFSDTIRITDLELALSVSQIIVAQHSGRIDVRSVSGEGTIVEVVLPLLQQKKIRWEGL